MNKMRGFLENKKGFTLMELLAVIVILAIIALIVTPIVLNIVKDSRKSVELRRAEFYIGAVEISLHSEQLKKLNFKVLNGAYDIIQNGNICIGISNGNECNGDILNVEFKNDSKISGWIYIKNNIIEWYDLEIDGVNIPMKEYTKEECFKTSGEDITEYLCGKNNTSNNPEILDVIIPKKINNKNITGIGHYTFHGRGLNSIIFPNSVKRIHASSAYRNKLTKLIIPNSVTYVGTWTFNSNELSDEDAFIYKRNSDGSKDKTTIVSYGGANKNIVIIPDQVKIISGGAFQHNLINEIVIPEGVTTIGNDAFWNNGLTTLIIPSTVTSIGEKAFLGNHLTSVIIKGKSSIQDFENYPDSTPFGWKQGYSDENIIWQP